jgi:demethylmenaquinone methyltransferase/2-methoxy-6-polyprenyl-1,4-benzoquinol methylase
MDRKYVNYQQKEQYIRDLFTKIAPTYEFMNHLLSFNLDRLWRRKAISRFFRPSHLHILDACCGTGELTELLRQKLSPGGSVIGVDFCDEMLEIARNRHRDVKNVRYELANIQHLEFPDAHFDAVYNCFSLRNLGDIPAAMREMCRVIKPGGQLLIIDITLPHSPVLLWYLMYMIPFIGRLFHGNKEPYSYLSASIRHFFRPEELQGCFINEGLEQVEHMQFLGGVVTAVCGTVRQKSGCLKRSGC